MKGAAHHTAAHPTAVVAEDEPILRTELETRLRTLWPELDLVASAASGIEAIELIDRHLPQIVFLDIHMPGLTGLDVARQIGGRCHIVFVTAYDAHAVQAFEQGAVDYVLKPYDNGRLALTLRRLRERLSVAPVPIDLVLQKLAGATRPPDYLRWIKASRGSEVDLIMVGDVAYFQAEAKYTSVYTATREALIRLPIKDLAAELDPCAFWQIHRSTIVNVEAVETVSRSLSGLRVKLRGRPERLIVSEQYRHLFKHM